MIKYSGIFVIALLAGALSQGWFFLTENRGEHFSVQSDSTEVARMEQLLEVNDDMRNRLDSVGHSLDLLLSSLNQPEMSGKDVLIATKKSHLKTEAELAAIRLYRLRTHRVSMAFVSEVSRYAVVNGKYVHVGDRLRGGILVKKIEQGKVLLSLKGTSLWLRVKGSKSDV